MNRIRRVARNVGFLAVAQGVTALVNPVLTVLIARFLGDAGFGRYSFILSVILILESIADFGLTTITIRDVARDRERAAAYFTNVLLLRSGVALVIVVGLALVLFGGGVSGSDSWPLLVFALGMLVSPLALTVRSLFKAVERMEYELVLVALERTLVLCFSLLMLLSGYGLVGLAVAYVGGQLMTTVGSGLLVRWQWRNTLVARLSGTLCRELLKVAGFLVLLALFWRIYFKIDIVLLKALKGDEVVGWYNAAYTLINFLSMAPGLILVALFPLLSQIWAGSQEHFSHLLLRFLRYLMVLSVPLALTVHGLSPWIIQAVYGTGYALAVPALQILVWSVLFLFPGHLLQHGLLIVGKESRLTMVVGLGALINLGLNLLLIPRWSYLGAATATVVTELVVVGLIVGLLSVAWPRDQVKILLWVVLIGLFTISGYGVLYLWQVPLAFVFSGIFYGILLYLSGGVTYHDFHELRCLLKG